MKFRDGWAHLLPTVRRRLILAPFCYLGLFWVLTALVDPKEWPGGWLLLGLMLGGTLFSIPYLVRKNPDVLNARATRGRGTKSWDKYWLLTYAPLAVAHFLIAVLDGGIYRWSELVRVWAVPGALLVVAGLLLSVRAMAENPFFEPTVRIQCDRQHRVVATGPYALIRHPGYLGVILFFVGSPLVVGSRWCLLTGLLSVAMVVVRTVFEDRTLQEELTGYADYSRRVGYRLVPGLW